MCLLDSNLNIRTYEYIHTHIYKSQFSGCGNGNAVLNCGSTAVVTLSHANNK